jgi:hypothetical protein
MLELHAGLIVEAFVPDAIEPEFERIDTLQAMKTSLDDPSRNNLPRIGW